MTNTPWLATQSYAHRRRWRAADSAGVCLTSRCARATPPTMTTDRAAQTPHRPIAVSLQITRAAKSLVSPSANAIRTPAHPVKPP